MEDRPIVCEKIKNEITEDVAGVRERFIAEFSGEIEEFVDHMADAYLDWCSLHAKILLDKRLRHVSTLVYSAVTLHILSMKLFVSGNIVAAGNLMRQVIESICMAFLCSSSALDVLDRYLTEGKFPTHKAVDRVIKHSKKLDLKREALEELKRARDFYNEYSHPSMFTLASHVCFETEGALYVGCSFDEGKVEIYQKEVDCRLELAKTFVSFIHGVTRNLSKQASLGKPYKPVPR
jgi:hypothetical protein